MVVINKNKISVHQTVALMTFWSPGWWQLPRRLKRGVPFSKEFYGLLWLRCFIRDILSANSKRRTPNRLEMFSRYKLAIFYDMAILSYPRIQLYRLFLDLLCVSVGSSSLENSEDLCLGYTRSNQKTQRTHCRAIPQVLMSLDCLFFFFFFVFCYVHVF